MQPWSFYLPACSFKNLHIFSTLFWNFYDISTLKLISLHNHSITWMFWLISDAVTSFIFSLWHVFNYQIQNRKHNTMLPTEYNFNLYLFWFAGWCAFQIGIMTCSKNWKFIYFPQTAGHIISNCLLNTNYMIDGLENSKAFHYFVKIKYYSLLYHVCVSVCVSYSYWSVR